MKLDLKKIILSSSFISCSFIAPSLAADIVAGGSTYDAVLFQMDPLAINLFETVTFDGIPEVLDLVGGGQVTIGESQTDLGGGKFQIDISFDGTTDLFPALLGGTDGLANIGGVANPLDLTEEVELISVIGTFTQGNGSIFGSGEGIGLVVNPNPWDGFFTAAGGGGGFPNAVGQDVRRVDFSFTVVKKATEPTSAFGFLALGTLGAVSALKHKLKPSPSIPEEDTTKVD